jgi:hypothetical protein
MTRLTGCVMLVALTWAAPSQAAPIFTLVPASGSLVGAPGDTVGWGYEVVNDDPTNWLVISGLNSDGFQYGTVNDFIFDYPILAPGATLTTSYLAGIQGLAEFTWDLTAPAGFINSGFFSIGAELWDGDPFAGGQFALALADFTAPYDVSVTRAPAPVPEPATFVLLASGLGFGLLSRRRRSAPGAAEGAATLRATATSNPMTPPSR